MPAICGFAGGKWRVEVGSPIAVVDDVLTRPQARSPIAARRLYEQGADHYRIWRYAERWCRWRRSGLTGLVSLKEDCKG